MGVPYAEVIGDPIAHSKSPLIHKFWLEKLGIEADYRQTLVGSKDLPRFLAQQRENPDWLGCNVTAPHKQTACSIAEEVDERAKRVGACNTLIRSGGKLIGRNTDVVGVIQALPENTFSPPVLPEACIIGMGGAALAALEAFRILGVSMVLLSVRNQEEGWKLHRRWPFGGTVRPIEDAHNLQTPHLVLNASPLGMTGHQQMPPEVIRHIETAPDDDMVVFDMVYAPLDTELLAAARRRGLRTVDGLRMLVDQAAASFELFFGLAAPRAHDDELRALLTR